MSDGTVRPGHNVVESRICCSTEHFSPHAPACILLLNAKMEIEAAREKYRNLTTWDLDAAMSIVRVLELCDEWDILSKGESPTTKRIRDAIYGRTSA